MKHDIIDALWRVWAFTQADFGVGHFVFKEMKT